MIKKTSLLVKVKPGFTIIEDQNRHLCVFLFEVGYEPGFQQRSTLSLVSLMNLDFFGYLKILNRCVVVSGK